VADGGAETQHRQGEQELDELVARRRFVVPALAFFTVFYGGFLVCVGYAHSFMDTAVIGAFTWAYLWALSLPDSEGGPFPLSNPAIVSTPAGFLACVVGTLVFGTRDDPAAFDELRARAETGAGAERAGQEPAPAAA
jgi:hypothetical protein